MSGEALSKGTSSQSISRLVLRVLLLRLGWSSRRGSVMACEESGGGSERSDEWNVEWG